MSKRKKAGITLFLVLTLLLITGASSPVTAEEKTTGNRDGTEETVLEDIVVTATSDIKMIDTPASISVITAKDLEALGIKNIGDGLTRIPGVFDDGSSTYYFSLRGTRSSSSGGPLVIVDGVPQDAGMLGYNYIETIPVSEIERIEVLRSPGSTVFGADSARGVISIITKKAKKDQNMNAVVKASAGSWNTFDEHINLSGGFDQWDLLFTGSRTDTDGYINNEQDRTSGRFKAGYNFSDQTRLGINLSYKDNYWQTIRGKNLYALGNDRTADEFKEDPAAERTSYNETDQEVSTLGMDFGYKGTDLFVNSIAAISELDEEYDARYRIYTSPNSVYRDDREQDRYKIDISAGYHLGDDSARYTPKLGCNIESTSLSQRRDYYNDRAGKVTSKKKADIDYEQDKYGIFFQNQVLFGDEWELNAGIRRDSVEYDVKNNNDNSVNTDISNYSWSLAPAYHWSDKSTSYASAGKSYWYPVAYYYQAAMEYMNPENLPENLKPESCMVYEIGHKQRFSKKMNLNLTLFWMDYKDKFAIFYDATQSYAGYKNIGDSEHKGIELEMDGKLREWFGYRLSGTYMEAKWKNGRERVYTWETLTSRDFRDLAGYDLNRIPRYNYTVGCDFYPSKKIKINADLNGTGSYYVDYLNRIEYGGKCKLDLGIHYDHDKWSLWALGKNVFDEEIESVYNSNGQLNTTAAEIARNGPYANDYYPRDGRSFEVGVSIRF